MRYFFLPAVDLPVDEEEADFDAGLDEGFEEALEVALEVALSEGFDVDAVATFVAGLATTFADGLVELAF